MHFAKSQEPPSIFFKIVYSFYKDERSWTRNTVFGIISLWIRSRTTIRVVLEADHEIKLLVTTSGKKGDNTNILKLQYSFIWLLFFSNLRKRTGHNFFQYCWMNVWRSLIAHIYWVASITTTFTPKFSHSPINSTN